MHPSLRLCKVHKPLIQFVGKRKWTQQAPRAHPAAPAELKKSFSDFARKYQASATAPAASVASAPARKVENVRVYEEFWEAPPRLWEQHIEEVEIEAIMSGGASLN
ncbi:hypothetical protein BKA93DRAFT_898455 [Sparassis latifolia]